MNKKPIRSQWFYFCLAMICLAFFSAPLAAQRMLGDVLDTSTLAGRQLKLLSDKYGNLAFSGYIQPQYQVAESKGANAEYQGGVFAPNSSNRFRLRRGRLRADYIAYYPDGSPSTFFVFQFDGTEQGVNIRDFWGRYYENKWNMFSITAGMMARPFGFEVQLSSSARETPERGRMSQILMKTERDLGVELTFNPRKKDHKLKKLQVELGVFNGQGLSGPREYDNRKDVIAHVRLKRAKIGNFTVSGGTSALLGGIASETAKLYSMKNNGSNWSMEKDSVASNIGKITARQYLGADMQVEWAHSKQWETELRAEYIFGQQTGTAQSSATLGSYPVESAVKQPLYTRPFSGAYFYLVQNMVSSGNQLIFKYDWYDPNSKVAGKKVTKENGFTEADVRYQTFGFGFLHQVNRNLKVVFWYDRIRNEITSLTGYDKDVKDDVFTIRAQFMF